MLAVYFKKSCKKFFLLKTSRGAQDKPDTLREHEHNSCLYTFVLTNGSLLTKYRQISTPTSIFILRPNNDNT